jgi:hypothetical protein
MVFYSVIGDFLVVSPNSDRDELFDFFSFALMQKKQKIKPDYFYPENLRTDFPIATPAARAMHSTRGSLPSAKA